jgi:hypothetical protein
MHFNDMSYVGIRAEDLAPVCAKLRTFDDVEVANSMTFFEDSRGFKGESTSIESFNEIYAKIIVFLMASAHPARGKHLN